VIWVPQVSLILRDLGGGQEAHFFVL
jgi:hypothetical protein